MKRSTGFKLQITTSIMEETALCRLIIFKRVETSEEEGNIGQTSIFFIPLHTSINIASRYSYLRGGYREAGVSPLGVHRNSTRDNRSKLQEDKTLLNIRNYSSQTLAQTGCEISILGDTPSLAGQRSEHPRPCSEPGPEMSLSTPVPVRCHQPGHHLSL